MQIRCYCSPSVQVLDLTTSCDDDDKRKLNGWMYPKNCKKIIRCKDCKNSVATYQTNV